MKFEIDYGSLVAANNYARSATSSRTLNDDTRNVIFIVSEDEVKLATYTAPANIRVSLPAENIEADGIEYIQLKASRLNKILAPFNNMALTNVDKITFETHETAVIITVHEVPNEGESEDFARDNRYRVPVTEVPATTAAAVNIEFGEAGEEFKSQILALTFKDMLAHMTNDSTSSLEAHLNIMPDFVFASTKKYMAGYQNKLPKALDGVALDYSQVSTILMMADAAEAVLDSEDGYGEEEEDDGSLPTIPLEVSLVNKNTIGFRTEGVEYFVKPRPSRQVRYSSSYDPMFKGEEQGEDEDGNIIYGDIPGRATGVRMNRIYAKAVIGRLEGDKEDAPKFSVTDEGLLVENKVFTGTIPFEDVVGDTEGIGFTIDPTLLKKLIIGEDVVYEDAGLWLYFIKNGKNVILNVMDETNRWLSSIQVRSK